MLLFNSICLMCFYLFVVNFGNQNDTVLIYVKAFSDTLQHVLKFLRLKRASRSLLRQVYVEALKAWQGQCFHDF